MNGTKDPVLLALTGQLPFIVGLAVIATLVVSWYVLRLYRRAVIKSMGRGAGSTTNQSVAANANSEPATISPAPLKLQPAQAADYRASHLLHIQVLNSRKIAIKVYGAAGAANALVVTTAILLSGGFDFSLLRFLNVFWVYAWPLALTMILISATSRRDILVWGGGYFAVLTALAILVLARNPTSTLLELITLWVVTNLPATVLMLGALARPIRAVSPLVLVLMILAFTGSVVAVSVVGGNENLLRGIAGAAFSIGMGATSTFLAINLLGFALFAVLGWLAARWIRRGYTGKRLNDQSLTLDALWFLFTVFVTISLAFNGYGWALLGPAAFVVYKLVVQTGFKIAYAQRRASLANAGLLLLRVFSLGKRSARLFDAVTKHWRYLGNVQLIAGPDLATTTVEPHEFLGFIGGKIEREFIGGPGDLDLRQKALDTQPDFDGRYRVHDFFCYDDTWPMVLSVLVQRNAAVLMDLRGFTRHNAGCVHELNELVNVVPLQRVVLVVDDTTDSPFLQESLAGAWAGMRADSPNVMEQLAKLSIVRLPVLTTHGVTGLVSRLCRAAAG